MTAWGSVDLAVEAMRRGARDFIQKPWENERLLSDRPHPDRTRASASAAASAWKPRTGSCAPKAARR